MHCTVAGFSSCLVNLCTCSCLFCIVIVCFVSLIVALVASCLVIPNAVCEQLCGKWNANLDDVDCPIILTCCISWQTVWLQSHATLAWRLFMVVLVRAWYWPRMIKLASTTCGIHKRTVKSVFARGCEHRGALLPTLKSCTLVYQPILVVVLICLIAKKGPQLYLWRGLSLCGVPAS